VTDLPVVAVAGSSGFVGRALVADLARDHRVIALGRRVLEAPAAGAVEWRMCDLYSLPTVERALAGAGVAVYLVHSMLPSARLVQARFQDLDLILADNFGRAAARSGVARIVYLGGLVPEGEALSPHLESRREVEDALGAHGVPVTALRAGLVIGAGGSSLEILLRLVERLPLMICPRWTGSRTQPIALDDAVAALRFAVDHAETAGRVCEVGGPDVLTYRELMAATARALGVRRAMIPVPVLSPRLSRLWVTLFSGKSRALVEPLVESLRHDMVVRDPWLARRMGRPGRRVSDALAEALRAPPPAPPARPRPAQRLPASARSVQRLPLPEGWSAPDVAAEYVAWLPRLLRRLLRAEGAGDSARFHLPIARGPALVLTAQPERNEPGLAVLSVTGGFLLAREPGGEPRLEFRVTPDGRHVLAAVHDFRPRLPWLLYRASQARVHLWVMRRFGRHLARRSGAPPRAS
jgi:uncharacterized protein YbjT (DUF2867 family)